jgi:hypothetical protein
MKIAALRVDIDTKKGLDKGVPLLLGMLNELDIKATFFVNMGTQWNLNSILHTLFRSFREIPSSRNKIGLIAKLGLVDFLKVLIHPKQEVGNSNYSMIQEIKKEGHDVGLHGGLDHSTWLRNYANFSVAEIEKFIMPTYLSMKACLGMPPRGFASPGFVSDKKLLKILSKLDFIYVSDGFAEQPYNIKIGSKKMLQIPITAGKDIPLIEYYAAKKLSDSVIQKEILKIINQKERENKPVIWYIHALFEPMKKMGIVKNLMRHLKDKFEITTFDQIAKMSW